MMSAIKGKNLLRPPVVAIVGHVDHGKTTLLDYIRSTNIAQREAGGITQSIGAYEVTHKAKKITFIDTPGHEAFSVMRAHGTAVADLAVLVVAADEGVKPQTTEAIEVLKKTETPFVVAISKIDSPNANIDKVKNELLSADVMLEGYGGDISWQGVSGVTGEGINELLDLIILVGEVTGLSFNPEAPASGFIIESKKDSRRGIVAHLIVKDGILRESEEIATPTTGGKIKFLENFLGIREKELMPSAPALVIGFDALPKTGEEFKTRGTRPEPTSDLREASPVIAASLESSEIEKARDKEKLLRVILKADTTGSLEVLQQLLEGMTEIGSSSVGDISDSDVKFAKASEGVIVGFRVKADKSVARLAEAQRVRVITSDVIYKLLEKVSNLVKVEEKELAGGKLEVLATFSSTGTKQTVGGRVMEGKLKVGSNVEIERGEEVLGKGRILSLQRNKEDIKEVPEGNECGAVLETTFKIEVGDLLKII